MELSQEDKNNIYKKVVEKQYQKHIEYQNTYTINICASKLNGFNIAQDQNNLKVRIPPSHKDHIKNCRMRIKNLYLPPSDANVKVSKCFIRMVGGICKNSNTIDNTLTAIGGVNTTNHGITDIVGAFNLKPLIRDFSPNPAAAENFFFAVNNGGVITLRDSNDPPGQDIVSALNATYNNGYVGDNYDPNWIYANNPFGKELTIQFLKHDLTNIILTSNGAAGTDYAWSFDIEVELLPDYKENDRINY